MGIHTRYSTPLIARNSDGSLAIRKFQTAPPLITRLPTHTQLLPTHQITREIEALERNEKLPVGFFACIANWISEAVSTIFRNTAINTEKDLVDIEPREITLLSPAEILSEFETQKLPETVPDVAPAAVEDLSLGTAELVHTGMNAVHWGTTLAALYGVAPQITIPINLLASLSSDTISFLSLPKDTHWLRQLLSFPGLSKIIINYNPWIARLFQAASLYNHVQHSASKLAAVWRNFAARPLEATGAGLVHLFNLASDAIFTAQSFGLVDLKPKEEAPPTPPRTIHTSNHCPGKKIIPRPAHLVGKECPPKAVANLPCDGCGLFSVEHYLVGLLDHFERGRFSGVKIDFKKEGLYYDKNKGTNWFEYYFCPVDIELEGCSDAPQESFTQEQYAKLCNYVDHSYGHEVTGLSLKATKRILQEQLPLRQDIRQEIDQFANTHFPKDAPLITVHYRGTDKAGNTGNFEARRVGYHEMSSEIRDYLHNLSQRDQETTKIFVATDEEQFANYLDGQFPGKVIISPSRKSTNGQPLHFGATSPYQTGREAIVDCHLLSKGDALIRTSSNLSRMSGALLKEGAQEIEVSKRSYQDPPS